MREDTNFKGSDSSCPSNYFLFYAVAQRQAKRRQKLKDTGQYEDYKKKNAEQQCFVRAKRKRKEAQLPTSEKMKLQAERKKANQGMCYCMLSTKEATEPK